MSLLCFCLIPLKRVDIFLHQKRLAVYRVTNEQKLWNSGNREETPSFQSPEVNQLIHSRKEVNVNCALSCAELQKRFFALLR